MLEDEESKNGDKTTATDDIFSQIELDSMAYRSLSEKLTRFSQNSNLFQNRVETLTKTYEYLTKRGILSNLGNNLKN